MTGGETNFFFLSAEILQGGKKKTGKTDIHLKPGPGLSTFYKLLY